MKRWKLIWHFQIKIIINFVPTSSVILRSAWEETRAGCVHWTYQSGSSWAQVHLSQMLICSAQLWGQKCSTCIWCKITRAGMPSLSSLGFLSKAQGKMWHIGEGKVSLCASTTKRQLSQLWVADALRLQPQAFRDITTLPSRGCIHNTLSKENLLKA